MSTLGCGQPSPTQKAPPAASASGSVSPPGASAGGVAGSAVAVRGSTLLALDARRQLLLEAPLPLAAPPAQVALPGRPRELVAAGGRILVTIEEPSMLLVLSQAHEEQARVSLPAGASGMAVSEDGSVALVASTGDARISAVDIARGTVSWSLPVQKAPRRIVIQGQRAYMTHLVGATMLEARAGWSSAPSVAAVAGQRIDGIAAAITGGTLVAHGSWKDGAPQPRLELVASGQHTPWASLPAGTFVRAMRERPGSDAVVIATDDGLVEMAAGKVRSTVPFGATRCRDAAGLAVAGDTAYLVCGDGHLVSVALGPSAVTHHAHAVDACDGIEQGPEPISKTFAKSFMGADQVERILRRYHCRYPDRTELIELATTHGRRKVLALTIGRPPLGAHDRQTIFINSGHHGDELLSIIFGLDAVAALLEGDAGSGPLADTVFVVAPLVNPDGNWYRLHDGLLGRKNGRDNDKSGTRDHRDGVDLNRNYPFRWGALGETGSSSDPEDRWYRGPSAGSEPETQGVMRLADSEKFAASMSFHTGTLAMCAPYTIPGVQNPEPDVGWSVSEEVVAQLPEHPEGPVPVKRRLYALDGCDQDWLRHTHGTVALLWEGAKKWLAGEPVKSQLVAVARASWMRLAERVATGPTLSGRVLDAAGRPVTAEVSIAEVIHHEGERWMTRCRDGRFDRVLPAAGDYTVIASIDGVAPVKRKVKVAGATTIDIFLPVVTTSEAVCPTPTSAAGRAATVVGLRDTAAR